MKLNWEKFSLALGCAADSPEMAELLTEINERPISSSDPDGYGDSNLRTDYWQFFHSGMEFGFRCNTLSFIHFFIEEQDEFSFYQGDLFGMSSKSWAESSILDKFGLPNDFGGGGYDALLGHVKRWIKYDVDGHGVRFEILSDGGVGKVTLIA
ncbi:hypothetical protein GIY21_09765 [Xanthomonas sontii]|uniref:Uncharacterized protein n=3 Tax=Xanthomonas TaxID=338 RepID=A0A6N7QEB4_9XANT|nr:MULTISPECIES: hypothetical protein [Xanthomonas]MRH00575.1 hypothetical protein [Xanthomonas sontii]MRH74907.1 hypothetical protein [Xanthomonas sontii]